MGECKRRSAVCAFWLVLALATALAPSARAADNLTDTPTAWEWYTGVTVAQVSSLLTTNNGRLVSLQVEQASPLLLTVAMVQNTGSYAKSWWWYVGVTSAQLSTNLTTNNARLIELQPYDDGSGTLKFAAVMVSNTGADAKAWWWYFGASTADISNNLTTNNARLVDVRAYTFGGTTSYAAIMISNTGADARAWWWYVGVTGAQVQTFQAQNAATLTSIDTGTNPGNTFNVIMEQPPTAPYWWWYFGVNQATVSDRLSQNGARLFGIRSYTSGGNKLFAAIMVNDSNAETTRVGQILRNATSGETGLYLKQVGGPVLASLQEGFVYDPASSIKILVALQVMRNIDSGPLTLGSSVETLTESSPEICPSASTVNGSETISNAVLQMLENSDNVRTRALIDLYGFSAINQTAQSVGMTSTNLSIYPGCGITNQLTLSDAAKVYEGISNGALISSTSRSSLYARMPAAAGDFTGVVPPTNTIIDQSATGLPLSAAQIAKFKQKLSLHYKAGGDTWCTPSCLEYRAITGVADIPICNGSQISSQSYVWGIFVDGASNPSADNAFTAALAEPLREPIAAALAGWGPCSVPPPVPASSPRLVVAFGAVLLGLGAFVARRQTRRRGRS
jgi:hypothetical protein